MALFKASIEVEVVVWLWSVKNEMLKSQNENPGDYDEWDFYF